MGFGSSPPLLEGLKGRTAWGDPEYSPGVVLGGVNGLAMILTELGDGVNSQGNNKIK